MPIKDKRHKKHATPEIKWAWERNGDKYKLGGVVKTLAEISQHPSLAAEEILTLGQMGRTMERLLKRWGGNNTISKINYLRRSKDSKS